MKRQLSNEFSHLLPLIFFVLGLSIAIIVFFLFVPDMSTLETFIVVLASLVIGFLFSYYSIRFYSVSFDSDFLYFSRFKREQKVSLDKVADIRVSVLPLRIIYLNTYVVTITYIGLGKNEKIRFLSRGIFRMVGSIREIPNLDTLRKFIQEKKYGR